LHAWELTEYEAVVLLNTDSLALRDPSDLFTHHLQEMKKAGKKVGAVSSHPAKACLWGQKLPPLAEFDESVLLIEPAPLNELMHDIPMMGREIGAVNQHFQDIMYELPVVYNTNTVMRVCEPWVWYAHRNDIRLLQYGVAKPWTYSTIKYWRHPFQLLSCWFWQVQEYCMLWDMTSS
jgi:alpha-N-acetylglucosamine transferase